MDTPKLFRSILHLNKDKDPRHDRPQRDWIENPYRVHQRIMWALEGALPELDEHGQRPRRDDKSPLPLFRIFPESGRVLVQTATKPYWKKAFAGDHEAPFLLDPEQEPDVREYAPDLAQDAGYLFQLLANPTARVLDRDELGNIIPPKPGEEWKAKRRAIRDEDSAIKWLVAHLRNDSGFEPAPMRTPGKRDPHGQELVATVGIRIRETYTISAFKGHRQGKDNRAQSKGDQRPHNVKLHAAVFEGVLRVTNPALALKTIQHGIGPAKGLGFGLLLLGRRLEG